MEEAEIAKLKAYIDAKVDSEIAVAMSSHEIHYHDSGDESCHYVERAALKAAEQALFSS